MQENNKFVVLIYDLIEKLIVHHLLNRLHLWHEQKKDESFVRDTQLGSGAYNS
jgi:hypothetical protein